MKYCMVNEIKPERLAEYTDAHRNPWEELLTCLKEAGTQQEFIFMLENKALVFIECDDIDVYLEKFGRSEVGKRWLAKMADFIAVSPFANESGEAVEHAEGLELVFDLNAQLEDPRALSRR
ncbi:MAG: L-rhamnose mutarotase [Clostridiales Family XIII bacterium]|jgi:L-rhamnose mutarotase|nr:L-rhamnose mutarotase [Clostridiales Family XIII bacterium]